MCELEGWVLREDIDKGHKGNFVGWRTSRTRLSLNINSIGRDREGHSGGAVALYVKEEV